MEINRSNEWDRLVTAVVGSADQANWPRKDPVYAYEAQRSQWKESPPPTGPVPQNIIDETNQDLDALCDVLKSQGVEVHRPRSCDWQEQDGFGCYAPRQRLLIAGKDIVDPALLYPCRETEIQSLAAVLENSTVHRMIRGKELVMDATNVCCLGDFWLYLESQSGSRAAAEWLANRFPGIDIYGCNFPPSMHIYSALVPLREGLILVNAQRVKPSQLPRILDSWDKIWLEDVVDQDFYLYPRASKWAAMAVLNIDPETVVVDQNQLDLIQQLEQHRFMVIPQRLRHARTLGIGFRDVVLDICRKNP